MVRIYFNEHGNAAFWDAWYSFCNAAWDAHENNPTHDTISYAEHQALYHEELDSRLRDMNAHLDKYQQYATEYIEFEDDADLIKFIFVWGVEPGEE